MTKHLRIFMLTLLVLISAAVMAQTTVDFSNGLPSNWTKLQAQLQNKTTKERLPYSYRKALPFQVQQ